MKVIKLRDELRKGAVPVRSPDHQRGNQRGKSKLTFGKLVPKKKKPSHHVLYGNCIEETTCSGEFFKYKRLNSGKLVPWHHFTKNYKESCVTDPTTAHHFFRSTQLRVTVEKRNGKSNCH